MDRPFRRASRGLLVGLLLVPALALAGCSSSPSPSQAPTEGDAARPPLPEPIHDERAIQATAGPGDLGAECGVTRPCFDYPFALGRPALLRASLTRAGDTDGIALELLSGGARVLYAATSLYPPVATAQVDHMLDPGGYVLRVHVYRTGGGSYRLDAEFLEPPPSWVVPCKDGSRVQLTSGLCAAVVGPPELRDREVSLATHPTDPDTVLITWRQGEFYQTPRIWAGFTSDAGATWLITRLENRGHDPPAGDDPAGHSYDSIAAFGSDGTAYVLYGGDRTDVESTGFQPLDRLTLASTMDGNDWSYVTIFEAPQGVTSPDYPDLAIAPDGQRMYVVTTGGLLVPGQGQSEGVWLWSSEDAGATWSPPSIIIPYNPTMHHYGPRVTAGEDGLVVVATNVYNGDGVPADAYITVSRDQGATFDAPGKVLDYDNAYGGEAGLINDPVALHGATISLVYADGTRIIGLRSVDAGRTWGQPTELGQLPAPAIYASVAAGPDDSLVMMAKYGTPDRFGIGVLQWGATVGLTLLHDSAASAAWELGDDYGAIGVASDGAVWTAWGMPTPGNGEDIWVARSP